MPRRTSVVASDAMPPGFTRRTFLRGAGGAAIVFVASGPVRSLASMVMSEAGAPAGFSVGNGTLQFLGYADQPGARLLRFFVDWDLVQPAPEAWDWSGFAELRDFCAKHEISASPVLTGCPNWLAADGDSGFPGYPDGHEALNRFAEFAVSTGRFFSGYGCDLGSLEVWSSPNAEKSSRPVQDPKAFARLTQSVSLFLGAPVYEYESYPLPTAGPVVVDGGGAWEEFAIELESGEQPYIPGVRPRLDADDSDSETPLTPEAAVETAEKLVAKAVEVFRQPKLSVVIGVASSRCGGPAGQADVLAAVTRSLSHDERCKQLVVGPIGDTEAYEGVFGTEDYGLLDEEGQPRPAIAKVSSAWRG